MDGRSCDGPQYGSRGGGDVGAPRYVGEFEKGVDYKGGLSAFERSLADHAAMLAINEPTVVLGSSSVRFLAPVVVGERCVAEATVREQSGKKHVVEVSVKRGDDVVLQGEMVCFVPPRHVLDRKEAST